MRAQPTSPPPATAHSVPSRSAGSTSRVQNECGGADKFCPAGSSAPQTVQGGYFSACDSSGDITLCTETTRTTEVVCGSGYVCSNGKQRRSIEFGANVCECEDDGSGNVICSPSTADKVNKRNWFKEMVDHLREPYGSKLPNPPYAYSKGSSKAAFLNSYTWSRKNAPSDPTASKLDMVATWYVNGDEGPIGGSGGSKFTNGGKFEIRNLQRSDFSDEAKAMQCLTLSETFRLDMTGPGQTAATPRLMYKPDFEDCMGVTFDLVATHPDGIAELKCHFDVRVSDRNDRPFWKEDVLPGANKYGDITDGSSNLAKLKKVRTIEERSARSAAITGPLEATDSDVGQEFVYKITAGNDDNFFRVNSCSGQLYVNKEGLDYNTKNAYQLTVDVTDDSEFFEDANFPNGLSTASTLVDILIEDKNDVPVICYDKAKYPVECGTNEAKEFSVYEDALPTDAIGTVLAADFDTNDVLQYTLDPAFDASLFVIGLTDGVIKLKTGTALDYETRQLYKVTVIVRDYYTIARKPPMSQ